MEGTLVFETLNEAGCLPGRCHRLCVCRCLVFPTFPRLPARLLWGEACVFTNIKKGQLITAFFIQAARDLYLRLRSQGLKALQMVLV